MSNPPRDQSELTVKTLLELFHDDTPAETFRSQGSTPRVLSPGRRLDEDQSERAVSQTIQSERQFFLTDSKKHLFFVLKNQNDSQAQIFSDLFGTTGVPTQSVRVWVVLWGNFLII